jgi:hypothetical protein
MVYIKCSELDNSKLGLFLLDDIEAKKEIIKYMDNYEILSYFGTIVNINPKKYNCKLKEIDESYYLISDKKIKKNDELIIKSRSVDESCKND